jgi:hypothetical protein
VLPVWQAARGAAGVLGVHGCQVLQQAVPEGALEGAQGRLQAGAAGPGAGWRPGWDELMPIPHPGLQQLINDYVLSAHLD